MNHLLLVYYHPIILDLAESFLKLFDKVTIACNSHLKDNYGGWKQVFDKIKTNPYLKEVECIPLSMAHLRIKEFDIVGCDGVFDGDEFIMNLCKEKGISWFCINGYVGQVDEPSNNIMAFSWHLPIVQYKSTHPHEGYVKEKDWRNIAEKGRSDGKNIIVFYPEMNAAKRFYQRAKPLKENSSTIVSFIHRYEECNRWNHKVFEQFKKDSGYEVKNFSGLTQNEVFQKMHESLALIHLKHGDCPGISVLESLIMDRPIITMSSFVKASFNQEVLIDGFNAIIADSYQEMIDGLKNICNIQPDHYSFNRHTWMLTNFSRQKNKLERFFQKAMAK